MNSSTKLFSIGHSDFRISHLLIIGILILSFSTSFLIRIIPGDYGWELNEFDPFFNFRATSYIIENGLDSYLEWNDDLSWYPIGRDVSSNSQVSLHLITAISYQLFGGNMELYEYTIIFPVIVGALTTVVIFGIVRIIGGTTAGLLASLFFSISLPVILRGSLGWFKSEPLGLFLGFLATYFFLSAINHQKNKFNFLRMIISGLIFSLSFSAWGGTQFFIIPIGILIIALSFKKNLTETIYLVPIFLMTIISSILLFERPGVNFIFGINGLTLIFPTLFLVYAHLIQRRFKISSNLKFNFISLAIITSIILISLIVLDSEKSLNLPTYRYLNSLNPFLITTDPLTESVSEHAITQTRESFLLHSVFLLFAGLGLWMILFNYKTRKIIKYEFLVYTICASFSGIYVSASFMRLEVFASFAIILLSSIGISILLKNLIKMKFKILKFSNFFKFFGLIGIFSLLLIPIIIPSNSTFFSTIDIPVTIQNGGTNFKQNFPDWMDSLDWLKKNSSKDSVIASWWDYGYWIQTLGERASIADNSTLNDHIIKRLAQIFFEEPDNAWKSLKQMEVDYFVLFVTGERLSIDHNTNGEPIYILGGGGDESKKYWFAKIADVPVENYLQSDLLSGTELFWDNTFLGKIIPFKPIGYANFATQQMSDSYQDGWLGIYQKKIEYGYDLNQPFTLVYSSQGFDAEKGDYMYAVLIYQVNDDYKIND